MKCLLVANGFFGDNFFISSVADKLKTERGVDQVDLLTGFPQVYPLLTHNPAISNVYSTDIPTQYPSQFLNDYDVSEYSTILVFPAFSFNEPPPIEAQKLCGIINTNASYTIYTDPTDDAFAVEYLKQYSRKKIAWMINWEQKAYCFSEYEYWTNSDHPSGVLGYGTKPRNISYIIEELSKYFDMIPVGVPSDITQFKTAYCDVGHRTLSQDASIMKHCDYFIGTEGGLANIAAGVGCKTLLTYEFIWQCYGPRGTVKRFENGPKLGPVYYFDKGHEYLPLYKTDNELVEILINKING